MTAKYVEECPFCKAILGDTTVERVYEDEHVLAFLAQAPVTQGHTLVIPKSHHGSVTSVSPAEQAAMMTAGGQLGKLLAKAIDGDGFNLHLDSGGCAGQGFPHTHLHVIPRCADDGFFWNWRCIEYAEGERAEILAQVTKRLESADEAE